MVKKILYIFLAVSFLAALAVVGLFQWLVVISPGESIRQENIERKLAMESPVYYADGVTKIGVFFQDAHRQYLFYNDLPENFIKAIVAAEDHQFFQHHGIDLPGFARAMFANLRAGRVVQGGSTITQQTAKNLFERKGRSIKSKLLELLFALRLEYHYPKEKILEFYANQFYVSGNGLGLGVAARYYFDKEPHELNLLEAAFIAGSVKRPNYYNPFIKKNEEDINKAKENAKIRAGYVLGQMQKLGMISANDYQQAVSCEIPFNKGVMQFRLNTLMDLVKDGLDDPEVEAALEDYGIDNVATSGVRIFTTIDKKLQDATLFAAQSELSRLDVRLRGYDRKELQKLYADMVFGGGRTLDVGQFLVARVVEVRQGPPVSILVSFSANDHDAEQQGVIDEKGILPLLSSLIQYKGQRWSVASKKDFPLLLQEIRPNDLVYVAVRETGSGVGDYRFDLEKYPELQGATLVMQQGKLAALVGGMDNYFYNRAIAGKRPMGSAVKPLLYTAAIQLGWNSLDPLNNARNMFVYHRQAYIPRPDHDSPHKWVSMNWAGVHSENVASVWLLYHLCDKLTPAQFKEVLAHVGMAREEGESYQNYVRRVRDKMGILVEKTALEQAAYEQAVAASEADLIFDGRHDDVRNLSFIHYSDQFEDELEDLVDDVSPAEAGVRAEIVGRNYTRYRKLQRQLQAELEMPFAGGSAFVSGLYVRPSSGGEAGWGRGTGLAGTERFNYTDGNPGGGWRPVERRAFFELLGSLTDQGKRDFLGNIRMDDQLSLATINLLAENMRIALRKLESLPPYEEETLHSIRDFRVLAGLRYLIALCREMGVASTLEPVLSFPLGSNVMSLFELSRVYEALTSGIAFRSGEGANPGLSMITRIESADGDVIYETSVGRRRLVDEKTSLAVSDILRNVVKFGTGRYAADNIFLHSDDPALEEQLKQLDLLDLRVPVMGKTGTANRFTNASFAGLVPEVRAKGDGVTVGENGFTVAAYVGFDDNRPMTRNSTRLAGSSGALPLWSKVAAGVVLAKNYAGMLDVVDLSFSGRNEVPLVYPDLGQIEVPVSDHNGGLPLAAANQQNAAVVTFGKMTAGGEVEGDRYFRPFWQNSDL
ncbi:MAG: transglycosylase domain-containing protein [Pseudomonadota bacterium]